MAVERIKKFGRINNERVLTGVKVNSRFLNRSMKRELDTACYVSISVCIEGLDVRGNEKRK